MVEAATIRIPKNCSSEFNELHRRWWSRADKQGLEVSSALIKGPESLDEWDTVRIDAQFLPELKASGFPYEAIQPL